MTAVMRNLRRTAKTGRKFSDEEKNRKDVEQQRRFARQKRLVD